MTTDARHHMLTPTNGGVHVAHAFEYANAAARTGATGLAAADEGKVARQLDDDSFWVLQDHSGPIWASLTGGGVPQAHASTHESGGSDPIKLDDLAAPDNNTDLDATTSAHGLLPKLGGGTVNFLRADGSWGAPPSSEGIGGVTEVVLIDASGATKAAYSTIAAAIAAAASGDTVLVGPGTWAESFTVPAGVTVEGQGGSKVTNITGTAATGTRVTLSSGSRLEGFRITTPTNNAYAILYAGAAPSLAVCRDIAFIGSSAAGKGMGNTGTGSMEAMDVFVQQGSFAAVYEVTAGELLVRESLTSKYVASITDHFVVSGGLLALEGIIVRGAGTADGFSVSGGEVIGTVMEFQGLSGSVVHITGNSDLSIRNLRASDCVRDIEVDAGVNSGSFYISGGELNSSKFDFPASWHQDVDHLLSFRDLRIGNALLRVDGNLDVGSVVHGQDSFFGEGGYSIDEMYCFCNTNRESGAWSDVTTEARSATGSTFSVFAGTGAGNCFYVGCSTAEFPGHFINIDTAGILGSGGLVSEYWNGSSWVSFYTMATDDLGPEREQHGSDLSELSGELNIRFSTFSGWATKTLNGQSAYWIRYRITAAWTMSPVGQQVKLHANATHIAEDGFTEFFGLARPKRSLPWHLGLLEDAAGYDPANRTIYFSADVEVALLDNRLNNGAKDGRAGIIEIPFGLDTSYPLVIRIAFTKDSSGSGDVDFSLYYSKASVGDDMDGTGAQTLISNIVPVSGGDDVLFEATFEIPIYDMLPEQFLGVSLIRDATFGNLDDTYGSNICLAATSASGRFWR